MFVYILSIEDFNIAQEKANIAKTTSDLSTNESSHENDNNKEPSGNKQKRRVCQQEVQSKKSLWSPGSSDIFGKIIFKLTVEMKLFITLVFFF